MSLVNSMKPGASALTTILMGAGWVLIQSTSLVSVS